MSGANPAPAAGVVAGSAGQASAATPPAVLVWSAKGGVGKSTIAVNLAVGLAAAGIRAGLLDADLHGPSAGLLCGLDERLRVQDGRILPADAHGVRIVSSALLADAAHSNVWRGALLRGVLTQLVRETAWRPCDALVVDVPPGTGEAQLELFRLVDVVGVVLVTTPHELALADVDRSLGMLEDWGIPVWTVAENMAETRCPACDHTFAPFPGRAGEAIRSRFPQAPLLRLPMDVAANDSASGVPLLARAGGRATELGAVLGVLVDVTVSRLLAGGARTGTA